MASECTLFDLLKYNDMDDDEHLTKDEIYSAFGERRLLLLLAILKQTEPSRQT